MGVVAQQPQHQIVRHDFRSLPLGCRRESKFSDRSVAEPLCLHCWSARESDDAADGNSLLMPRQFTLTLQMVLEVRLACAAEVLCSQRARGRLVPACAAVEVRLHHLTTEAESNACEWEWRVCSQAVLTYAFIPASLAYTAELWVICPKSVVCFSKSLPLNPNLELLLVSLSPGVWASGALGADSLGGRRIRLALRFGDESCSRTADSSSTPRKQCTRTTVSRTIAVEHGA